VRWHRHVNYCEAPERQDKGLSSGPSQVRHFGSINTEEACTANEDLHAHMFSWMIHVFPYEPDFKTVFSIERTTVGARALMHGSFDRM